MMRSLAALVALFATAAIAPALARAAVPIIGGTADTTDTAVGTVTAGSASCSGALIAPHLMLTAAHCVTTTPVAVTLDDGSYTATTVTAFPGFNLPTALDSDLAVLVLDHDSTLAPLPFAPKAVALGDAVTVVGYGAEGAATVTRLAAANKVAVVDGPRFEIDGVPDACVDDAGGVVLVTANGVPAIAGVVSTASVPCGTSSDSVATFAYLPWLAGAAPGATLAGGGPLPTTDAAPTIAITRPGDGATMAETFRIDVRVGDDYGALVVSVTDNDVAVGSASVTGSLVALPLSLTPGAHTLVTTTTDASGNATSAMIAVTVEPPTYPPGEGGAACWDMTDCLVGKCTIVDGVHFCASSCANDSSCPLNMYCDTTTLECIRGSDSGCTVASSAPPWLAIGSVLLCWFGLIRRSRRT